MRILKSLISVLVLSAGLAVSPAARAILGAETGTLYLAGTSITAQEAVAGATVRLLVYGKFFCSGILIDRDLVLTAAHCLDGIPGVGLYAGFADGSQRKVRDAIIHPGHFSEKKFFGLEGVIHYNDIAVMSLLDPAPDWTKPALLPAGPPRPLRSFPAVIAGYGRRDGTESSAGPLRWGQSLVSHGKSTKKHPAHLNLQGAQACKGDSGGPVFAVDGAFLVALGVHSTGTSCGGGRTVSRAEDVLFHRDWIRAAIMNLERGGMP